MSRLTTHPHHPTKEIRMSRNDDHAAAKAELKAEQKLRNR